MPPRHRLCHSIMAHKQKSLCKFRNFCFIEQIFYRKNYHFVTDFPFLVIFFLSDYIIVLIFSTIIADYQEKCRQFNDSYRYFSIF